MKTFLRKTILGTLILSLVLPYSFLAKPVEASGWPVFDAANFANTTIIATASTASSFANTSLLMKENVLDAIAYMLAKAIIRQITSSVVNWINSGFQGSPSFVTDPGSFFVDIGDQLTGEFISKTGILSQLCTPFSLDLRIALALKYRPYSQQRYACTLSSVIQNVDTSVKNASINGFTAGDFRQGGWPAFVSLTTEPQNNYIGASILAEQDLASQIADRTNQQKDELNQGQGFLSWKTCKDAPVPGDSNFVGPVQPGAAPTNVVGSNFVGPINTPGGQVQRKKVCETQTPGKVIAGALETQLGSPVRELELADEFNEIVNALFAQLVSTVLSGGLRSTSGRGPSDSGSYLNQLQQEQDTQNLAPIQRNLIDNVDAYLKNARIYKDNKSQSLAYVTEAKAAFDRSRACLVTKNDTSSIADLDSYVAANLTPLLTRLTRENQNADLNITKLLEIQVAAQAATTTVNLNDPAQEYSGLLQNQSLITAIDINDSKEEIQTVKDKVDSLISNARFRLTMCEMRNN